MPFALLILLIIFIISISVFIVKKANKHSYQQIDIENSTPMTTTASKEIELNQFPNAFQQIVLDIETQFFDIVSLNNADKIDRELWFNSKKLFYERLPEILNDYLALDDTVARNTIVDTQAQLTSYDIALNQLKSIMGYFHQVNTFSNKKHIQKILVNQRYLTSIYSELGMEKQIIPSLDFNQHTDIELNVQQQDYLNSDLIAGQNYLEDYCTLMPKISQSTIAEIGKLSITQIAVEDYLENELSKLNISSEYGLESLEVLLIEKIPSSLAKIKNNPNLDSPNIANIESKLFAQLTAIYHLLEQMLKILDKNIRLDIKLNQLQEVDGEIWGIVKQI